MPHHHAEVSPTGLTTGDRSVLLAAQAGLALNVILAVAKVAAGLVGRSDALLADGLHSSADAAAALAVAIGLKVSRRPADADHPRGHAKAEGVAALIVGVVLAVAGLEIGFEAVVALWSGEVGTPARAVLYVAGASVILKEGMYRYQSGVARRRGSSALTAAAAEHRTCALKTVITLLSVAAARLGPRRLDPAAGLFIAVLVVVMAFRISRRAVDDLMDRVSIEAAPSSEAMEGAVRSAVMALPGVARVDRVRSTTAPGGMVIEVEVKMTDPNRSDLPSLGELTRTAVPPPPL